MSADKESRTTPAWFSPYGEKIIQTHRAIYGNGDDGLKMKVDRNTRWRKAIVWSIPVLIALGLLLAAVLK